MPTNPPAPAPKATAKATALVADAARRSRDLLIFVLGAGFAVLVKHLS